MTKEEKELLLKDLCARLPYRVKALYGKLDVEIEKVELNGDIFYRCDYEHYGYVSINLIKPYFRPMSSMTEEEYNCVYNGHIDFWSRCDYCNSHHLDYRGLIEKGLALEAPKDMYK